MNVSPAPQTSTRLSLSPLSITTWLVTLLVSALPDALGQQFLGLIPSWLFLMKILLVCFVFLLSWVIKCIQPLRYYLVMLFIYQIGWRLQSTIRSTPMWSGWEASHSWSLGILGIQFLKFCIALLTLAVLFLIFRCRTAFFLVKGKLSATAEPVRWLGINQHTSWKALAPIVSVAASAIMLLTLALNNEASLPVIVKALPLVLFLAAANAVNEGIIYHASLLAPLEPAMGKGQTQALNAVFFGLAHAAGGVPLEIIPSVLMTGFLGWFIAKCMLETRGFTWPWFIHFVNDIPVFAFLAVGSIAS